MNFYGRIAGAIDYYIKRGYTWVDTAWIVPVSTKDITFSGSKEHCYLGSLVGSAEQGFIQLMLENKLRKGNYVSAGPCFRFDDLGQPGKHPYFFKVELCGVGLLNYDRLLLDAQCYMGGQKVKTAEGFDLELKGIEIGSYGYRTYPKAGIGWSYGTGIAEPRYTEALERSV